MASKRTVISGRISTELKARLDEACKLTQRSQNFLFEQALNYYLDELLDLQIAKDRLNDPTDKLVTLEEFSNELSDTAEVISKK